MQANCRLISASCKTPGSDRSSIVKSFPPASLLVATWLIASTSVKAAPKTISAGAPASSPWTTGANWSPGIVPGATDDVVIDYSNQTTPVTTVIGVNSTTAVANSLTFGSGSGTALGAFEFRANVSGVVARTLTLGTSGQTNAGLIEVHSSVTGTQSIGTNSATFGALSLLPAAGVSGLTIINNSATQVLDLRATIREGSTAGTTVSLNSAGGLIQFGTPNTYTGATTIGDGSNATTVRLMSGGSSGNTSLGTAASTATVNLGSTLDLNGFTLSVAKPLNISGSGVAGAGALHNSTGSPTYSGLITLGNNATIHSGGTLLTFTGGINNNGHQLTISGGDATVSTAGISGAGGLTKTGSGTLTLNFLNTFTGDTNIADGSILLGNNTVLQNSTLNYTNSNLGSLNFGSRTSVTLGGLKGDKNLSLINGSAGAVSLTLGNNNSATVYSGVLSGTGSLFKTGSGSLTLTGGNNYSGSTTIGASGGDNVGSVITTGSGNIGTGPLTVYAGTVDFDGASPGVASLVMGGGSSSSNATITVGAGHSLALNGSVSYSATNHPLGAVIGGAGKVNLGNSTVTRQFTVSNSANTTDELTISATIEDGIVGTNITKPSGAGGTLVLAGDNTYSGTTTINAGILRIEHDHALGSPSASTTVNTGAALEMTGGLTVTGEPLVLGSTNGVSNNGGLRSLSDGNTWAGNITLTGGASRINSDVGTLIISGSSISTVNYVLSVGGAGDTAISNTLNNSSGTAGIIKDGSGKLTLSGTSSAFTGATGVNAGVLVVNGSLSNSPVTVGDIANLTSSALLLGNGTVGTLTVGAAASNTGASVSPGNSPNKTGILSVNGDLLGNSGASLTLEIGGTTAGLGAGGLGLDGYDRVNSTGNVILGPGYLTLALSLLNNYETSAVLNDKLFILVNNGSGTTTGEFSGLAQASSFSLGSIQFRINYADTFNGDAIANDISLTVVGVPEPTIVANLLLAASAIILLHRRRH